MSRKKLKSKAAAKKTPPKRQPAPSRQEGVFAR
jgi:hypothetical protein